jgi:hypothetical protein
MSVQIFESYETPAVCCDAGDLFIKADDDGSWWVYSWDGGEVWPLGDEPFDSKDAAFDAALVANRELYGDD